jgi:hypothetical protein
MRTKEKVREVVFPQLRRSSQRLKPIRVWRRVLAGWGDCLTLVLSRWSNPVSHSYTISPSSILIRGIQAVYDLPISTVVVVVLFSRILLLDADRHDLDSPQLSPLTFAVCLWRLHRRRQK